MPWTYSGNPSNSASDAVRFKIGDTDSTDPQLLDAEVLYELAQAGSDVYQAAIACCTALIARYTRRANKSSGDLSIQWRGVADDYMKLKAALRSEALRQATPVPYSGGMRESDRDIDADDDDLIQPNTSIGAMDDQGSSPGFTQVVPGG